MGTLKEKSFDVIVVGAGHAGIEACLVTARKNLRTLMVSTNLNRIGYMSCNPSIGGLAKGHIVREVDALGGEIAEATDETCIQFRRLNTRKGPAVRGSRAQCDKSLYTDYMTKILFEQKNLEVIEAEVKSLKIVHSKCCGVYLDDGVFIESRAVILTTGTFMNAIMHTGEDTFVGGRIGDSASVGLSESLRSEGFVVRRLKTGTPARIDSSSIDWTKTIRQKGDDIFFPFSFSSSTTLKQKQVSCFLTRTTEKTHDIIRKNLNRSPLFKGIIQGVGPRYCPSIEDKIVRFSDKESHQVFLEPEGLKTASIYPQGVSTSLPKDVQESFLKSIPGLENLKILKFGYAVEYDFFDPLQIKSTLETKEIKCLYFAGQINGTSGYEEAAGQGFIAGINAALSLLEKEPLILSRSQSYIGVLIDDLITKGTEEPYRMFTSRAEHRLVLREDNTFDRLAEIGHNLGTLKSEKFDNYIKIKEKRKTLRFYLESTKVYPTNEFNQQLSRFNTRPLVKPLSLFEFIRRPEINFLVFQDLGLIHDYDPLVFDALEIDLKYSGYIKRQNEIIEKMKKNESIRIGENFNYDQVFGLSIEEKEKLKRVRPETLGQAERMSGINPSAIQAILIYLKGSKKIKEL